MRGCQKHAQKASGGGFRGRDMTVKGATWALCCAKTEAEALEGGECQGRAPGVCFCQRRGAGVLICQYRARCDIMRAPEACLR